MLTISLLIEISYIQFTALWYMFIVRITDNFDGIAIKTQVKIVCFV